MNNSYKHNSAARNNAIFIVLIISCLSLYLVGTPLPSIFNIVILGLLMLIIIRPILSILKIVGALCKKFLIKRSMNSAQDVDNLNWYEFELYIANWLKAQDYTDVRLTEKYDLGIDIIAKKGGVIWGIQVKHSKNVIKIEAVREVVAALKIYGCERAMVVTNSSFTERVKVLAKSNNCVLIDGRLIRKLY